MITRTGALLTVAVWCAGMAGCVSADVYRVKEQEALTLQQTNQEMQMQNRALTLERNELQTQAAEQKKEKEAMREQIEKQHAEIGFLQNRTAKLEKDGEGQRDRIEKLSGKLADLNRENQRLATMTRPENLLRTLGDRLADLERQVDAVSAENQKLKARQVAIRSGEERPAIMDKPARPVAENQQPDRAWSGQTAEDSALVPVQDERRLPAQSEEKTRPATGM